MDFAILPHLSFNRYNHADPLWTSLSPAWVRSSHELLPALDLARDMERAMRQVERECGAVAPKADEVEEKETEFAVKLDVRHFKPEEVEIKVVKERDLIISGKHEEKSDEHGFISREFTRRYALPKGVVLDKMTSSLAPNGLLAITAPRIPPKRKAQEAIEEVQQPKKIPIKFVTGNNTEAKMVNAA